MTQAIRVGSIIGPASSTDNAVVRFDGASGNLVQNSGVTISDAGVLGLSTSAGVTGFADKGGQVFNVEAYGAIGDGVTDDTAEIQAAIDAAETSGGGVVLLPPGTYLVSATLTIDANKVYLVGSGKYNTTLYRASDYGNTVRITGNSTTGTRVESVGVRNLGFQSAALVTSGAHISVEGARKIELRSLFMQDGFGGIELAASGHCTITDWYLVFTDFFGGSAAGRYYFHALKGHANYPYVSVGDTFVSDFNIRGNTSNQVTAYGVWIDVSDGLWFCNGHIGNTTVSNILLNHTSAGSISLVFVSNVMLDEGTGNAVLFQGNDASSTCSQIEFENLHIKGASTTTIGILFAATSDARDIHFNGGVVYQNGTHGIQINSSSVTDIHFNGLNCYGNSMSASNTYSNLIISAACAGIYINGGKWGGGNAGLPSSYQTLYGIELTAVACNNILVSDADLTENATASISNASTGANVRFINCHLMGSATVASAATVTLPQSGEFFTISGTTGITNITASWAGRRVSLAFSGALTVTDGGNLKLAGTFTSTADHTLSLACDGTNWYETGRTDGLNFSGAKVWFEDGVSTAGNARGAGAVDLQATRSAAAQVASGTNSTISGGLNNTASGQNSVAAGGSTNTASGFGSAIGGGSSNISSAIVGWVPGGVGASQSRYGSGSWSSGAFVAAGDAQSVECIARVATTGNATTETFLDGAAGTQRLTIASGKALLATVLIVGKQTGSANVAVYLRQVCIVNNGGTTEIVGSVVTLGTDVTPAGWGVPTITADNTNDALNISVTGATATNIRWVARISGVEVLYA